MDVFRNYEWTWNMMQFLTEYTDNINYCMDLLEIAWYYGNHCNLLHMLLVCEANKDSEMNVKLIFRENNMRIKLLTKTITIDIEEWVLNISKKSLIYLKKRYEKNKEIGAIHYFTVMEDLIGNIQKEIENLPLRTLYILELVREIFNNTYGKDGMYKALSGILFLRCICPLIQLQSRQKKINEIEPYKTKLSKFLNCIVNKSIGEQIPIKEEFKIDDEERTKTLLENTKYVFLLLIDRLHVISPRYKYPTEILNSSGYDSDLDVINREYKFLLTPPVNLNPPSKMLSSSQLVKQHGIIQIACKSVAKYMINHMDDFALFLVKRNNQMCTDEAKTIIQELFKAYQNSPRNNEGLQLLQIPNSKNMATLDLDHVLERVTSDEYEEPGNISSRCSSQTPSPHIYKINIKISCKMKKSRLFRFDSSGTAKVSEIKVSLPVTDLSRENFINQLHIELDKCKLGEKPFQLYNHMGRVIKFNTQQELELESYFKDIGKAMIICFCHKCYV